MLKFDLTMEPMKDALFIATYNTAEGGTLRKYHVGNNPDKVELKADPTAVWKGLIQSEKYELEGSFVNASVGAFEDMN